MFLLWCVILGSSTAAAEGGGSWLEVRPSLVKRRSQHTATLLSDGRVLLAGGFEHTLEDYSLDSTASCEIYDPATGTRTDAEDMEQYRSGHTATLLADGRVLVVGGYAGSLALTSAEIYNPVNNTWTEVSPMRFPRGSHTATLLQDGRVLVAGGIGLEFPNVAEVYDPRTDTWSEAGVMEGNRALHTATLLKSGQVLLVGGMRFSPIQAGNLFHKIRVHLPDFPTTTLYGQFLRSMEVFDPSSPNPRWTSLGDSLHDRAAHSATLLPDGKVLITGGLNKGNNSETIELTLATMEVTGVESLGSSELFDPGPRTLSATGGLRSSRAFHTATLLPGGKPMVAGGYHDGEPTNSVELYDQASGQWSPVADLPMARVLHTATLLPGGRVFVAGGLGLESKGLSSTVLYQPGSGRWTALGSLNHSRHWTTATLLPHEGNEGILVVGGIDSIRDDVSQNSTELYPLRDLSSTPALGAMSKARDSHTATLLPDGKLLVVGGEMAAESILDSVEQYDHLQRKWTTLSPLDNARFLHTATLLPDGRVLVAGGTGNSGHLRSAELYDPGTSTWSSSRMEEEHSGHTATLLPDGRVLIAGGEIDAYPEKFAEVYDPLRNQWSETTTKMVYARKFHTATLLPNGKVLVAGGEGDLTLKSAELFDPISRSWSETGSMSAARSGHTATLLPSGMVLVTGGYGSNGWPLSSAEVYDPATGSWSPTPPMQEERGDHSVALLPDGSLFIVGGFGPGGALDSAELYSAPGVRTAGGPHLTTAASVDWQPGSEVTLQGSPLWIRAETGGGSTNSSAADFPVLTLRSLENGRWVSLSGAMTGADTLTATLPALPIGHYVLTGTSGGLTSGKVILLQNTTPPDTLLQPGPDERTRETTASFSFSSPAKDLPSPEDAFECALDTAAFDPCDFNPLASRSVSLRALEDGAHTFKVRARDLAGNVDDEPASYTWIVDTQAPVTTITSAPPTRTGSTSASFSFSTEAEDWEHFECSLDGAGFLPCPNPFSRNDLGAGSHSLEVRAVDTLGNTEATPATYTWIVQRSHYSLGCTASDGSAWTGWLGSLVLLGLLQPPSKHLKRLKRMAPALGVLIADVNGNYTVAQPGEVLNRYAPLGADVAAGATRFQVFSPIFCSWHVLVVPRRSPNRSRPAPYSTCRYLRRAAALWPTMSSSLRTI